MKATHRYLFPKGIVWEVSDTLEGFHHRLVHQCGKKILIEGPWVTYESIAILHVCQTQYQCCTAHWEGVLPTCHPFTITKLQVGSNANNLTFNDQPFKG